MIELMEIKDDDPISMAFGISEEEVERMRTEIVLAWRATSTITDTIKAVLVEGDSDLRNAYRILMVGQLTVLLIKR